MKKEYDQLEDVVIPEKDVKSFILRCLDVVGCNPNHGAQLADVLIGADYRGFFSHGINRLHVYVDDLQSNACAIHGQPEILKRKGATAWVDGKNLLGPVVGNYSMQLAIEIAREFGIGWVVAKDSNHFGIASWYAKQALDEGLLGMAFTNTSPCVFPTRSSVKSCGSNPICLVAPAKNGDSFLLDMATSTVAYGKVEVARNEGQTSIPSGWGCDSTGKETNDPSAVLKGGGLQPLGGQETTSGYKGTGLSMMVEIFCGILGDANFGRNIRQWQTMHTFANLGQCFIAIDPTCFAPDFSSRLQTLLDDTRNEVPVDPCLPVLVPGDPERIHMKTCDKLGGIIYSRRQVEIINELAEKLNVPPLYASANGH